MDSGLPGIGDAVVISEKAFNSGEPLAIMCSLIDYLEHLRAALVRDNEISTAALEYNAVDFYIANVANGGHAQFEGNAGEVDLAIFARVGAGLAKIGHHESLHIWERFMELHRTRSSRMTAYFASDHSTPHPDDELRALDTLFFSYYGELEQANADSLLSHPGLVVLDDTEIAQYVAYHRDRLSPTYDERRRLRFEAAPPHEQAAMAFCETNGLTYRAILGPTPVNDDGRTGTAWMYRLADHERRVVVMFDDGTVEHRANIDS